MWAQPMDPMLLYTFWDDFSFFKKKNKTVKHKQKEKSPLLLFSELSFFKFKLPNVRVNEDISYFHLNVLTKVLKGNKG